MEAGLGCLSSHDGIMDVGSRDSGTDSVGHLVLGSLSNHVDVMKVVSRHCGTDSVVHLLLGMKNLAEDLGLLVLLGTVSSHDGGRLAVGLGRELMLILGAGVLSGPEHKVISINVCQC